MMCMCMSIRVKGVHVNLEADVLKVDQAREEGEGALGRAHEVDGDKLAPHDNLYR